MAVTMASNWTPAIDRARTHAPFLKGALARFPEIAAMLERGDSKAALAAAANAGEDGETIEAALRRRRVATSLVLAIGDLAGAFDAAFVMRELSLLADQSLDAAIAHAIARRVEGAAPEGFVALALGKQGGGELNYSSDIDPILLYDPDTLPRRPRDEPGEAASRYARDVVGLLSRQTPDGFVFRVDLRLRPASEISPPAISVGAAISHYESSALPWERAAFIRARSAAGDTGLGQDVLDTLRPFIWRSSLDFNALEDIRKLTARVRETHDGESRPGPGFNVKLGRGGIREIEFFAQAHQLIHGGRDPSLRSRQTVPALRALAAAGVIDSGDADLLGACYLRLRCIEHRLQMVADRQTHTLPAGDALDAVARLDGAGTGDDLVAEIADLTDEVARRYDALLGEASPSPGSNLDGPTQLETHLAQLGFDDPKALAKRVAGWQDGRYRALRSPAARDAFEELLPSLLEAFAGLDDPDRSLLRWESILEAAPTAINFFRLLQARPALMEELTRILALAPEMASELGRRPALLDALIDRSALLLPGAAQDVAAEMNRTERGDSYEQRLDRIRVVTGEARFALGAQLVAGDRDPLEIGRGLARVAEAALQVAAQAATQEFALAHGVVPGGELLVVGLGRFGGGMLTHASDLDIIYLFSGDHAAESDGPRPLGASLYFNRLAQRVTAALSVPTAQGALYEVDTRLRPQGNQGPLAASMESFARYQRRDAWTWEHMALTRARLLVGSPQEREEFDDTVRAVLTVPRDASTLRARVLKMRREMARSKPPLGALDAKLMRGGLVDLEFLIHFLQLREGCGLSPDLPEAIAALADAGHCDAALGDAHGLMTRLLIAARMFAPRCEVGSPAAGQALATACGEDSMETLLQAFARSRHSVAQGWQTILDTTLETD